MASADLQIKLKYGTASSIVFPLYAAGTNIRKSSATLAAGDFKILRHTGGTWSAGNPTTTTPTEISTSGMYALPLTATELTPDDLQYPVIIAGHDAAGAEWDDVDIVIRVDRSLDADGRVNVGAWVDAAPNALISGRVDVNAQVVADKVEYTLTNGEHVQVAVDVLDATAASHNIVGSIGEKINASGLASDPWNIALPGAYGAGKAGYILGTTVNTAAGLVASIKTQTDKFLFDASNYVKSAPQADTPGVTTLLGRLTSARAGYLDLLNTYLNYSVSTLATLVNAVKTNTDNLPADPASEASVEAAISAAQAAVLADTLIIKNKTNNLPASPAAVGSQMDLVNAPNATAITAIQSGLALASSVTTVLNRLGAWTGSGRNTLLGALQSLFRKDADAVTPTDINADLGSGAGTFDNTTDSTQAIRDNMSASSAPTVQNIVDGVYNELRSAHTTPGSFGQGIASVQGNVTGSVASVSGNVGGNLNGNVQGNVVGSVGSVLGNVGGTVSDSSGVTTLLTRLSSDRAGYLDALAGWSSTILNAFKALARKDAAASADIGGTHNPATDSEEALSEALATFTPGATITENITIDELNA